MLFIYRIMIKWDCARLQLFLTYFSYSCAPVDKLSTDILHRVVPLP